MTDRPATLLGDLRERADGGFDGWCWAPDRPQERLVIELLVNDTLAVSMVAALLRRDLVAFGCGDGRHGFSLRLPPDLAGADAECLITARERGSGQVFGRVLRTGPGRLPPGVARVTAAEDALRALWQDVAPLRTARSRPAASAQIRAAFGRLGQELAAPAGTAAARRPAAAAVPALTLVLAASTAATARRVHAALAPALAETGAAMLAVDPPDAPQASLAAARGGFAVLLAATGAPSAAALLALARAVAAAPDEVLVSEAVARAAAALVRPPPATALHLPAPLGVLIGGPAALWQQAGEGVAGAGHDTIAACADLALRARLLGRRWRVVIEPMAADAAPSGAPHGGAIAQLHRRWGFGA